MKALKIIGSGLLIIVGTLLFMLAQKERKQEREEGEFHILSTRTYGCSFAAFMIAVALLCSISD
jgi:hypothetical protein